jgi:hypothetical protein
MLCIKLKAVVKVMLKLMISNNDDDDYDDDDDDDDERMMMMMMTTMTTRGIITCDGHPKTYLIIAK